MEETGRKYDKVNDSIQVEVNHMTVFALFPINTQEAMSSKCPLKDIGDHWAKNYISELCDDWIVSGQGNTGLFEPNNPITRWALLKMLMISAWYKVDSLAKDNIFVDVDAKQWYAPYVLKAKELNFIEWYKSNIKLIEKTAHIWDIGQNVATLQKFLWDKWYYKVTIDGYFSEMTRLALQSYQANKKLRLTWVLDVATLGAINSDNSETDPRREFRAWNYVNRAEALAMILKVYWKNIWSDKINQFTDVKEDAWFSSYVAYAFKAWIVSGKSEKIFAPNDSITRAEASKMVVNSRK